MSATTTAQAARVERVLDLRRGSRSARHELATRKGSRADRKRRAIRESLA